MDPTQNADFNEFMNDDGLPYIPENWDYLIHGTSKERWNEEEIGKDFVVHGALSCVEKEYADRERKYGYDTARSYGGNNDAFQIWVIYPKSPNINETNRKRFDESYYDSDIAEHVKRCYSFQWGRHPGLPNKTHLIKIGETTSEQESKVPVMLYIPENMIEIWKQDVLEEKAHLSELSKQQPKSIESIGIAQIPVNTNIEIDQETQHITGGIAVRHSDYSEKNKTDKDLSPEAQELQAVFNNMKTYQGGSDISYSENFEKLDKFFTSDMQKIVEIYGKSPNNDDVCGVLRENLHLVSGATLSGASHQQVDAMGDFMHAMGKIAKETPEMSDANKAKVFSGLAEMQETATYNPFGNSGRPVPSLKGLLEDKDSYMEKIYYYGSLNNETFQSQAVDFSMNDDMKPKNPLETVKAMKFLNDNQADYTIKHLVASHAMQSFPDNSTVYVNATNMLKEVYKDDPLEAFSSLSWHAPKETSPTLIQKKYESDKTKLLDDVKSQIAQSSKGEKYSPEVLGEKLYKYGFNEETKQFAQAILENNKDNKELISAYNKARIKDKPLGNIRTAFMRKSKLEHL